MTQVAKTNKKRDTIRAGSRKEVELNEYHYHQVLFATQIINKKTHL